MLNDSFAHWSNRGNSLPQCARGSLDTCRQLGASFREPLSAPGSFLILPGRPCWPVPLKDPPTEEMISQVEQEEEKKTNQLHSNKYIEIYCVEMQSDTYICCSAFWLLVLYLSLSLCAVYSHLFFDGVQVQAPLLSGYWVPDRRPACNAPLINWFLFSARMKHVSLLFNRNLRLFQAERLINAVVYLQLQV